MNISHERYYNYVVNNFLSKIKYKFYNMVGHSGYGVYVHIVTPSDPDQNLSKEPLEEDLMSIGEVAHAKTLIDEIRVEDIDERVMEYFFNVYGIQNSEDILNVLKVILDKIYSKILNDKNQSNEYK